MAISTIEKNKQENIDLLQIEYLSDLPISDEEIIVIESNNSIAITIRKFLNSFGFTNIHICKDVKEGIEIFAHLIGDDVNVPVIIDMESYKNIKNNVEDILDIQPNAKIIIITTKERKDPQILKLFDIGISSIIQKPLTFDDFEKNFSKTTTDDKIQETKNSVTDKKKDLELPLFSLNQITYNKLKDTLKVEQTQLDNLIRNALDKREITPDREILEAACNQCNSTNITQSSECPDCHGINFKQKNLIEHYACGKVYPKDTTDTICPQCNKEMGSPGVDYNEISESYVCSSCNKRFPVPLLKFSCFDCGNTNLLSEVSWVKNRLYKIQK